MFKRNIFPDHVITKNNWDGGTGKKMVADLVKMAVFGGTVNLFQMLKKTPDNLRNMFEKIECSRMF